MTKLQDAARAVLKRWDSPQWDWTQEGSTAGLMADLRAALAADEAREPAQGLADERAAFEAWAPTYHKVSSPGPLTMLDGGRRYFYGPVNASWAAWQARALVSAPRVPLTDEQMLACVRSVGAPAPMGLMRDRGAYEVTEPTWFLTQLVRAIERAHGIAAAPQPKEGS
jgi:hypothetical protein